MSMFTLEETVEDLRTLGGVPVIDVATGESSWGRRLRVPIEVMGDYGVPGTLSFHSALKVANGAFTEIGMDLDGASAPIVGMNRTISVDGADRVISSIEEDPDSPGGETILLMLAS